MFKSLFEKFKEGLKKTTSGIKTLFGRVGGLFGGGKIDPAMLDELEEALIGADFGVETTQDILAEIREAWKKNPGLRGQDAAAIGATVLKRVLAGSEGRLPEPLPHKPEVICLIGVNGSGKTTTTAKLGWMLKQQGMVPVLGACDTFRAAANEQIRVWSERLDIELVSSHTGADSAAVAFDAHAAALSRGRDVVILDTAGRLHTKSNLVAELQKIKRVLQKKDPSAPHHSWLVLDGSHGSNAIEQARVFQKEFGLTGLVITKLDGTSRGGSLVGIYRELRLPIYFVGLGEQPEDLQPFSVENYVDALFAPDGTRP